LISGYFLKFKFLNAGSHYLLSTRFGASWRVASVFIPTKSLLKKWICD